MARLKIAKIMFITGALCFVARPFLGFVIFDKLHHPAEDSILIKIFSKRKPELTEDSSFSLSAIGKKLANPDLNIYSRFNRFLDVLFPAVFPAGVHINARLLREMQPPARPGWLLYGKIII
ncbi:MAG TPA: hypothetical protein VFE53_19565 [Mucilaginibacter sp.]|jgi:hypothetical protein|nr:hypothetical protein [Mucilaginibacter sp.]